LGIDSKVGTAAVMFKQGEELQVLRKHVGDECQHIVYEAEVIGLTLAAKLVAGENFVEDAIIGADNQVTFHALESTKGSPGQHLVHRLQEKVEEIYDKHTHDTLEIWWTPGHEGIKENERADEEAYKLYINNSEACLLSLSSCLHWAIPHGQLYELPSLLLSYLA